MKWDFAIGNPAYQEPKDDTSDKPVYNYFMDEAQKIADKVEMITPARFLFNAGKTPKAWNEKMLHDRHFKVMYYEPIADNVFSNTEIKGGVAISYRDSSRDFGEIGTFTKHSELNDIIKKVASSSENKSLCEIMYQQSKFELPKLYKKHPEYKNKIGSEGKERRLTTPIFEQLEIFKNKAENGDDIQIIGLVKNIRKNKYVARMFIEQTESLDKYKVLLSASGGAGHLGETISQPIIAGPNTGFTQSFVGLGLFNSENEALNAVKYVKSKFARVLLGVLKVTQHAHKDVWAYVPLQDFTDKSDINWNASIADIDQQLYKKYGLSQEEIDFIETHVKEMA